MVKIKVRPEDFVVEELVDLPLAERGKYSILKLEKRLWNTLDVIDYIARKTRMPRGLFSRAGLKDRYSLSTQYLSFKGDFRHTIREKNFALKPMGKSDYPLSPRVLSGNSFSITLRNMTRIDIESVDTNIEGIQDHGFPNYFDEQRFGSARHGHGFVAKKMILEHYQGALKLLMCYSYSEDSAREKKFKAYCLSHWRDWHGCLQMATHFYQPILDYLCAHPRDYKNALKKIDREFLNLYLLAYQSYIFNEVLARLIKKHGEGNVRLCYSMGDFLFYRALHLPNAATVKVPMVNEKTQLTGNLGKTVMQVLKKEGIRQQDLALRKMRLRGVRFKPFDRRAVTFPQEFSITQPEPDELYTGKYRRTLKCILPPGTYATILIKRLLLPADLLVH
jgi:tRNA pseudouridine13 synthase